VSKQQPQGQYAKVRPWANKPAKMWAKDAPKALGRGLGGASKRALKRKNTKLSP